MFSRERYIRQIESGLSTTSIVVLIGARQVGKTSIMKTFNYKGKKCLLNGQDPEIAELFQKMSTIEPFLKIQLNDELEGLLMIDEFQYIEGISTTLKLLTDKYSKLKIICTGSSSLDILQKVEESLAGRVRVIDVYSLSLREYLQFTDDNLLKLYDSCLLETEHSALTKPLLEKMNEYLLFGGFPRAVKEIHPEQKIEVLNDIYKTYLLKDVRNYINNEHVIGFNKMLRLLASQIGNLLNVNELSKETGLPYKKCEEYLYLLEQMYIIRFVEPYFANYKKMITKMKKIYFTDIGLRNAILGNFSSLEYRTDSGALFENYILLELLKQQKSATRINFYRTSDGTEVDFVMNDMFEKSSIECKYKSLYKPINIRALNLFSGNENIKKKIVFNQTLNNFSGDTLFIQGYFAGKV